MIEQLWWALNIQQGSAHHHKPKLSNSLLQYSSGIEVYANEMAAKTTLENINFNLRIIREKQS